MNKNKISALIVEDDIMAYDATEIILSRNNIVCSLAESGKDALFTAIPGE